MQFSTSSHGHDVCSQYCHEAHYLLPKCGVRRRGLRYLQKLSRYKSAVSLPIFVVRAGSNIDLTHQSSAGEVRLQLELAQHPQGND